MYGSSSNEWLIIKYMAHHQILLLWHYGRLSLTLAYLMILAHSCLSGALCIQLLIPNVRVSVCTLSDHLDLGVPIFRYLSSLTFKSFLVV